LFGHCDENRHGEEGFQPVSLHELFRKAGIWLQEAAFFLNEKAMQELQVKQGLSFIDARKKFFENPKPDNKSNASVLRHSQGVHTTTKTVAISSYRTLSLPISSSRSTAFTQTDVLI
jgi:hypothetical protein